MGKKVLVLSASPRKGGNSGQEDQLLFWLPCLPEQRWQLSTARRYVRNHGKDDRVRCVGAGNARLFLQHESTALVKKTCCNFYLFTL